MQVGNTDWFQTTLYTRLLTGMTATHGAGRELEYPPVVAAMDATVLHPIGEYIRRR